MEAAVIPRILLRQAVVFRAVLSVDFHRGRAASGRGYRLKTSLEWMEVKELIRSGLSLMPEGFEKTFAPQDLADLIAAIQGK